MNLSKDMHKVLTDEIRTAIDCMKKVNTPEEKLFFFSAVYGAAFRIMNIQYDAELAFLHNVISSAYSIMNTSLTAIKSGQGVNTFPKNLFEKLENILEQLLRTIEEGKKTYPLLEIISNLSYSTTGNGYYLYLKGVIKLE